MNSKTGKTLILGGFAADAALSALSFLEYFLKIGIISGSTVSIFNIISTLAMPVAAAGFGILFLANRNIMDLAAAGGCALSAFNSIAIKILGPIAPLDIVSIGTGFIGLVVLVCMICWAYRLYAVAPIATFAVTVAAVLPFLVGFISSIARLEMEDYILVSCLVDLVAACALAGAAFLDFRES